MNQSDPFKGEQIHFPVDCHFRIIAEDLTNMQRVLETVLLGMQITSPVEKSNQSAKGKYISFNVSVRVESLEMMQRIDSELRAIRGVKMVL